jgi:hypothetical protein
MAWLRHDTARWSGTRIICGCVSGCYRAEIPTTTRVRITKRCASTWSRLPWTVAILSRTIVFRGDAVRLHRMPWTVHTLSRIEGKPSSLTRHAHVKLSSSTERPATHHDHAMAIVMRRLKTQVAGTTYTGFDEAHTLVCRVRASAINKRYHGSRKVSKWASTRVASSSGVNRFGEA